MTFAHELVESGKLGRITQIDVKYNGFARRWDWQTLQKKCAGNAYNTGPHPVGIALSLIDFDPNVRVVYSRLDRALNSGDADDFVKIILDAPGKPVVDIEASSTDAYTPYNLKIQGTKGTFKASPADYEMVYIVDGENPEQPVQEDFLHGENSKPIYCTENLVKHTEEGKFEGTAFNVGTARIYEDLYYAITEGKPMRVVPEMAERTVAVIETAHAQNPLPVMF